MAERRENSVLFSLRELRQIEDERVRQEHEAESARAEAEQRAKDEAIRLAREDAERRARDEEERLRRIQDEKERQIREEQMRLEAEKHRADVEAQMKIEEARLQAEAHVAAAARKATPLGLVFGSLGVVLLIVGAALAYMLLVYIPARDEVARRIADDQINTIRKQLRSQQEQFDSREHDLKDQLTKTTDQAARAKLEADIAATQARKAEAMESAKKAVAQVKEKAPAKKAKSDRPGGSAKKCDPDDPLCGSGL